MITSNSKNRHYLAIKGISKLLRRITSNHNGDFYCLYCLHVDRAKKKLGKHQRICKDHDFCHVKMPDENNKNLKYISGEKPLKAPFVFMLI